MTQEEKQLLLKDLCARLPYEVHGEYSWKCGKPYERELTGNLMAELILSFNSSEDSEFKPYLRPMSSMTEEEYEEYEKANDLDTDDSSETLKENMRAKSRVRISKWYHGVDWLIEHHFDYRGLIPMGLALEAPEDMYK